MVKEFEHSAGPALHLVFDAMQVWGEGKETTLEYGIKITVAAADYATRKQVPVRVWGGRIRGEGTAPTGDGVWGDHLPWPELLKQLAMVAPGEGCQLSESLGQIPTGSAVVAAVAAGDTRGIQAVLREAGRLSQLALVVLEGFGEDTAPLRTRVFRHASPEHAGKSWAGETVVDAGWPKALQHGGITLIHCQPGALDAALRNLEALNLPPVPMPVGWGPRPQGVDPIGALDRVR